MPPSRTRTSGADHSTSVQLLNGQLANGRRRDIGGGGPHRRPPVHVGLPAANMSKMTMREELRSLQFWRAIIAECLATFLYVFIVCMPYVSWPSHVALMKRAAALSRGGSSSSASSSSGHSIVHHMSPVLDDPIPNPAWLQSSSWTVQVALMSGFAMSLCVLCFGGISGGHVNPALTFSLMVTRKVTLLRSLCYIAAQCGGSIAGAALLYGLSIPGHQGTLGSVRIHELLTPWQGFGVEVILAFAVVFAAFAVSDKDNGTWTSPLNPSPLIGAAYLVCTLAGLPSTGAAISPARALGPAFVMNRWENHWVYWLGPMSGGLLAGLIYEYIFYPKRSAEVEASSRELRMALEDINRANSSAHSQDDDYDDPTDAPLGLASLKPSNGPRANSHQHLNYNNGHVTAMGPPLPMNVSAYQRHHQQQPQQLHQMPARGQLYDTSAYNRPPMQHYEVLPGRGEPTYGTLAGNPHKASSIYGSRPPPTAESVYGSSVSAVSHRPPSSASAAGNYATIHGNRPGGSSGGLGGAASLMLARGAPLHRLEYADPDSTKF